MERGGVMNRRVKEGGREKRNEGEGIEGRENLNFSSSASVCYIPISGVFV